jgi:hypothetical protein
MEKFEVSVLGYLAQIANLLRHETIVKSITKSETEVGSMAVKVIDKSGVQRDWAWAVAKYGEGLQISTFPGDGYRLVQLTEVDGIMAMTCTVLNEAGGAVVGQQVAYMWPDGEALEITNGSGMAEHTMGAGEGYAPDSAAGPISWQVRGAPSERLSGLGWLWGTNHEHLQSIFQWTTEGD